MDTIFNLPSSKLAWYYWALIILGVVVIAGGVFMLMTMKDEKDVELEYGDRYSSVFDPQKKEDEEFFDKIKKDGGYGFGSGLGSGFVGAGGATGQQNQQISDGINSH